MNGVTIMHKDQPVMKITWDKNTIQSQWLGKHHIKIPPDMYPGKITIKAFVDWCETRQPPRTRIGIDELLRTVYKMKTYLPIQMCRKSHGITHEDDLWMLFDNEGVIKYETLSVR